MRTETVHTADATALYRDGELAATALYSSAGQCWHLTDERTATHLGRFAGRRVAEAHLELVR